jgi:hypothetical protein
MVRPEVGAYLLGQQMARLGVSHLEGVEATERGDRDLARFLMLADRCKVFTADGCVGASRARGGIRGTRVLLLWAAHMLFGKVSDDRIQEVCGGMSAGSFAALRKDLENIGVLPGLDIEQQNHLLPLVRAFQGTFPSVPDRLPVLTPDLVVTAPWAAKLDDADVADFDDDCVSLGGLPP